MLNLDGSFGEGGGQIVRTALSLAILTQTSIKLTNIRANRINPGLAPQHLTAVKAAAKICDAKYSDLEIGAKSLSFQPGRLRPGIYRFDIGTAGSITLALQTLILPALFYQTQENPASFEFRFKGGTDVNWSPSYDYFNQVFLGHLRCLGVKIESELLRRGYYPKGGGEILLKIYPNNILGQLELQTRGQLLEILGFVHNRLLSAKISVRIVNSVKDELSAYSPIKTSIDSGDSSYSPGCGITIAAIFENTIIGSSMLGKQNIPAEEVGKKAANNLIKELNGPGTVDIYSADQLIPYLGLLGGEMIVNKLTEHIKTNIWLVEQFIPKKFKVEEFKIGYKISIKN